MAQSDVLHYDGKTYDADDLDYAETREVRRLIRMEIWDEATEGPFDWKWVDEYAIYPAMLTVFKRREDPSYSVQDALKLKLTQLTDEAPPTKPAAKTRAKSAAGQKTPEASGSPSS